jgi:hypothetical protein
MEYFYMEYLELSTQAYYNRFELSHLEPPSKSHRISQLTGTILYTINEHKGLDQAEQDALITDFVVTAKQILKEGVEEEISKGSDTESNDVDVEQYTECKEEPDDLFNTYLDNAADLKEVLPDIENDERQVDDLVESNMVDQQQRELWMVTTGTSPNLSIQDLLNPRTVAKALKEFPKFQLPSKISVPYDPNITWKEVVKNIFILEQKELVWRASSGLPGYNLVIASSYIP